VRNESAGIAVNEAKGYRFRLEENSQRW